MYHILWVFIGGGLGSITRFLLGKWIAAMHFQNFPYATLVVNISACFLVGLIVGWGDHKQLLSVSSRLFWVVGFCGGFSTFSTFSLEVITLLQTGVHLSSILYIFASVVLCVSATYTGLYLGGAH